MDRYFPGRKVQPAFDDAGVYFMQMLQQPHARAAMNAGYIKGDDSMIPVRETVELLCDLFIVQVGVLITSYRLYLPQPGMRCKFVIIAKAVLAQQLVDQLTSFAA